MDCPLAPDGVCAAQRLHRFGGCILWDERAAAGALHQLAPGAAVCLQAAILRGRRQRASGGKVSSSRSSNVRGSLATQAAGSSCFTARSSWQ